MADDSVHALLADEELVDCTLLIDGEGMGHLLGDDKAGDLAKGAQLKLALWLALVLAKKNMVRISLPNRYGPSVRADLEAGPTVVDLHSIAPYYYTVGHKLADATGEDSLRKELRAAISGDRFEKAFDWSQVSLDRDVSELRETLAREEQELFDAGYRAARDVSDVASKQKLVIHLLGAEKELDQASAFARFLSRAWRGAPFRSLVPRDVEVHFVGPEVPEGWRPVAFRGGGDGDDSADAPSVAVYGHRGLYHRAVAEAAVPRARAGDASTNDAARRRLFLATAPDLVVCPDAGIAAFASWVPTVDLVLRMNVPALVTDLTAEAARMAAAVWRRRAAECIECVASRGAPIETDADVALNPFRRVLSARGNDTTAPTYANGFGFAWVPGEGVAPL